MDVKKTTTEELIKVLVDFNGEMKRTKITKIGRNGQLFCRAEDKSTDTKEQAFAAYDELGKRGEWINHETTCQEYLNLKNRYERWHGILCERIVAMIVHENDGQLPQKYVDAINHINK